MMWQDILRKEVKKSMAERMAQIKRHLKANPYITLPEYSNVTKEEIESFLEENSKFDKK